MTALAPIVETQPLQSIDPVQRTNAVVQSSTTGPVTDLLRIAVEKGTPVAELKELVDLHERMEQRQAQKDYSIAMASFQKECPSIKKSSTAQIVTKGGSKYSYNFAELDEIARTVNPILAKFGLSYTWDAEVKGVNLECVCTVHHINGHSVSSRIVVPTTTASAMSDQQKVGAALTFAKRLSLSSALGLTTTDDDTDGKELGAGHSGPITEEQADELSDRIAAVNADMSRFLKFFGVPTLADIPQNRYTEAMQMLDKKGARK